eukprot:m.307457 g.307457  ORF g.307457 m.307457 type:complete len:902 (+) comp42308_c0_seq1:69-2774(+)
MAQTPQIVKLKATVKQVLSADSIVLRGQPKGGPPPERTLGLSGITAPRLGRKVVGDSGADTKDEPFAFEAREFVRKLLAGKQVTFAVEYKVPKSEREYGTVWIARDGEDVNVKEELLKEGLVEVRRTGTKPNEDLCRLEDLAKAAGKGKWNEDSTEKHVREVKWSLENVSQFVDRHHGKEMDGIVEFVRDACTMRIQLVPTFQYITVMLSGIKTPTFKNQGEGKPVSVAEPFAEEAKFFTESRLLQKDVKVVIEGVSNQNVIGTVLHPAGNISEFLLREGFGYCVEWSIRVVTQGREKLRAAEKLAKEKQLRRWKGYQMPKENVIVGDKEFVGKVVEVVNADGIVVKLSDGQTRKFFLSSLKPPRPPTQKEGESEGAATSSKPPQRTRQLYDVPYMFEAREFLRKKLIGKKVQVLIDYVKPAENSFPEKTCATVSIGGINVAEALISKGFATVVRHRQDDNQRSSKYDDLLSAESRAKKNVRGIHAKSKDPPLHRVADLSGDYAKAKQFLPFLQRAGRSIGVVEFVASGSRLRIFLPKDTCLMTLLLAGISCPKASQTTRSGQQIPGAPYGEEALAFTKDLCLQREVEVEVDGMDKAGNFIGWLFVDGKNVSVSLVEEGMASVHFSAEKSKYGTVLYNAEAGPKSRREKIWEEYEEPKPQEETAGDEGERKVSYTEAIVTEIDGPTVFWAQNVEMGPQLEEMLGKMREELDSDPPLPGSYKPKKGDKCAAVFSDGLWYRVLVEKVAGANQINVLYIDFGNREVTVASKLAPLPADYTSFPSQAKEYHLAFVMASSDEEWTKETVGVLQTQLLNHQVNVNVEYKVGTQEFVTAMDPDSEADIGKSLVADGLLQVDKRKEKRLAKLVANYTKAQTEAKLARKNLWQYGDITADSAAEFGYSKK